MSKIATRDSYAQGLIELAASEQQVLVLDGDLATATRTAKFAAIYPERHINCGIAEANMMGVAAGLSLNGYVPFVSTFAMFSAGRAFEQIRNSIAYPNLNVKIGATHGGISVGEDGASHQCNEDLGLMRTIPNMVVINPCDDIEARAAVKAAYNWKGPVYLRFGRLPIADINTNEEYHFEIGRAVQMKTGTDCTIIATGLEVSRAQSAVEKLAQDGFDVGLVNVHTLKPIDKQLLTEIANATNKIVTVEEHSTIGGLGSAVLEALALHPNYQLLQIGVNDCFGQSATAEQLLDKHGLSSQRIYEQVLSFLN